MSDSKTPRRCLILSQGPVPTPEHTKVEGGGLRCWGLAKGLRANDPELEITIAYHASYKHDNFTNKFEGISIATWEIVDIPKLTSGYDSIIISYCMGDLSTTVADTVRPDQQLILDCYVPIYVEISARETDNMEREYNAFHADVGRWSHVLQRGDIFLCASEAQKNYYKGVLSAVGRINPATYNDELILVAPYGIYRDEPNATEKPITKLLAGREAKKILWFGGIYPWFDLRTLVDAVELLNKTMPAELIIVGAKNPFNDHPDFVSKYDELSEYIESSGGKKFVYMQDWVKFEDRVNWYLDSDLVVVINKLGEENKLAWRTRLVDFMWANLPVITNAGDPLGEELINNEAAIRLIGTSAETIASNLEKALGSKAGLQLLKTNLSKLKKNYYWDVVTKSLSQYIAQHKQAADREQFGDYKLDLAAKGGKAVKIKKAYSKARMMPAYARKYGLRNTYIATRTTVRNQFKKVGVGQRTTPGVVMVAHQLDLTGAPYVFIDLAKDIVGAAKNIPVEFHTFNPTDRANIALLNKMNIKPALHLSKEIGIQFVKGDVVVLNTAIHSTPLKESIYRALDTDELDHLVWFIHEDEPELIFSSNEIKRIESLLGKNKIVMYIAAEKSIENYQKAFENTANIRKQPYKYVIPQRFQRVREANDFDKLSFILSGSMADGRKGQLPIFYAFKAFKDRYYSKNPEQYRDFELVFVGVETDFLSRQILRHAPEALGDRFKHYGRVSHERSFELMMTSNVTICYSLRECLPLFVFEGMGAGHPILRNDSSGMEEQLFKGKNGSYLSSNDFDQVVSAIEEILRKQKTTNQQLADMSKYSHKVALEQANNSYEPVVNDVLSKFRKQ